jgi:hypothetical protein
MRDGAIVNDEQSVIGELPETIKRRAYFVPRKTAEDDLAGVSALMESIPDKALKSAPKKSKKPARKRVKKYVAKTPRKKK